MKFLTKKHVMVDLETLSTRSDAVMLSIGAVAFTFDEGIYDEFYVNVSPNDGIALGLHVMKSTAEFWSKQPEHVMAAFKTPKPIKVKPALEQFFEFYKKTEANYLWAHGSSFDPPIIGYAASVVGLTAPYKYWDLMCNRTVLTMLDVKNSNLRKDDEDLHNALSDARAQTLFLIDAFKSV